MRALPTLQRDDVIRALGCSHFELGRLLRDKTAPLPVRVDGAILFYQDELELNEPRCREALTYWRRRRDQSNVNT
jgi:hypothetical protein